MAGTQLVAIGVGLVFGAFGSGPTGGAQLVAVAGSVGTEPAGIFSARAAGRNARPNVP